MPPTKQWRPELRRHWRLREPVHLDMTACPPPEEPWPFAKEARRWARTLRRRVVVNWPGVAVFGIP